MRGLINTWQHALAGNESGQILPWMALLIVLFLGVGGLCMDLGHAYIAQRELQASTEAAALAGGYALAQTGATTTTVTAAAKAYSSLSTGKNASATLPSVTFSDSFKCLNALIAQNILCTSSPTNYNAVQVTQTTTITTIFIQALKSFGLHPMTSMTITATSTAAMKGTGAQYNVALLIDTTASMGQKDTDASCNTYRITCAESGIQTLLKSLTPCTASSTSTSCTGFDNVSIFTFPAIKANTAQNDYNCSGSNPTTVAYTTPVPNATWSAPTGNNGTYQVTNFLSDYSSTNKSGGALAPSSYLTVAAGGKSGCSGLQTPGGEGTYFAGAIYAALSALNAEQLLNPGSKNALIILSDGSATSTKITASNGLTLLTTGLYPSLIDECHQAITAAQSASSSTTVYSVAYGASSSTSDCNTDIPGITPCSTMQQMATSAQDFYSDATASANAGQCTSTANPNLTLNKIFQNIGANLQNARLIPNGTS